MKKKRYYIRMTAAMLVLVIGLLAALGIQAAAATAINTDNQKFQQLTGDAAYLNYADNYYIDVEDLGILDGKEALGNTICNIFFFIIKKLGHITTMLFYYCMNFDLAELFRDQIGGIQKVLKDGLFEPLFILAFCGAAVHMIKKLIQRDMMGAYGQVLKVVGILVLSVLIVKDSATVLSAATGITKSASAQILSGMQGGSSVNLEDYAASAAGTLWVNIVHQPWVYVEFWQDTPTEEEINNLLSDNYAVRSTLREDLIQNHAGRTFLKEYTMDKASFLILLLIPTVIKCVIYIVMGILTMAFQLLAVFYVLLAPIILILVMIPGYESMMSTWLKKLLETQLGVLILSFIMGLLIKVDDLLFTNLSAVWGWLIVLVVQVALEIFVIMKRQELLGLIGKLQRTASNPGYARAMLQHSGANGAKLGYDTAVKIRRLPTTAVKMKHDIGNAVQNISETAGAAAEMAGTAVGTVIGGAERLYRRVAIPDVMAAAGKAERPVLSHFNKEHQEENIIHVAPRGRGENRHLERVEKSSGRTDAGQALGEANQGKIQNIAVSSPELRKTQTRAGASEIQYQGNVTDTSLNSSEPPGEIKRPNLKDYWKNDTLEQQEAQSKAQTLRQEYVQQETVSKTEAVQYQGNVTDTSVSPSEPQKETLRPNMKEFKRSETKIQRGPSGQLVKDTKKSAQDTVDSTEIRKGTSHPNISARERQKENQAARQQIPAERPRYTNKSNNQ